jgi:hypothetical protein
MPKNQKQSKQPKLTQPVLPPTQPPLTHPNTDGMSELVEHVLAPLGGAGTDTRKNLKSQDAATNVGTSYESASRKGCRWAHNEDAFIKKNASLLTANEIGAVLKRTDNAVLKHAAKLGVTMAKYHRAHFKLKRYKNKELPLQFTDKPLPDGIN